MQPEDPSLSAAYSQNGKYLSRGQTQVTNWLRKVLGTFVCSGYVGTYTARAAPLAAALLGSCVSFVPDCLSPYGPRAGLTRAGTDGSLGAQTLFLCS